MSGAMPLVLQRLAEHMEWTRSIRQSTTQALVYPAILSLAILGLVITLVTFLVPRIVQMFPGGRDALPTQTKQVLVLSDAITSNWKLIVAAAVVLGLGGYFAAKTRAGGLWLATQLLRIPRLGEVLRMFATAKFASTAGTLQNAGCQVNDVLELAGSASGNARMTLSFLSLIHI